MQFPSKVYFNPTLVIFIGVWLCFILFLSIAVQFRQFSPLIHIPVFALQTLLGVLMFTPLHDSVHRVASKNRALNDAIMHGTWPIFLNAPQVFKMLHLAHHAKTNQGLDDPDHFTSSKTWTGRWLRSFLLIFSYYEYALRKFQKTPANLFWMAASILVPIVCTIVSLQSPLSAGLLWAWILPSFASTGLLAFLNTAWPHHPGDHSRKMKNTKILLVWKPLEWILFNQNLHLVHHLRPTLPWYEYPKYWRENRERLLQEGAEVVDYRKPLNELSKSISTG